MRLFVFEVAHKIISIRNSLLTLYTFQTLPCRVLSQDLTFNICSKLIFYNDFLVKFRFRGLKYLTKYGFFTELKLNGGLMNIFSNLWGGVKKWLEKIYILGEIELSRCGNLSYESHKVLFMRQIIAALDSAIIQSWLIASAARSNVFFSCFTFTICFLENCNSLEQNLFATKLQQQRQQQN